MTSQAVRERVRRHRERLRAQGMRPIQVWVPDLRDPARAAQLRRDVAALARHPSDAEGNAFLDAALNEIEGWEA